MNKIIMELIVAVVVICCLQGVYGQTIDTGIYQWATWSDWTACNATCNKNNGVGHQTRTRMCLEDGDKVKLRHCQVPYIDNGDEPINIVDSHVIIRRGGSVDPSYVETAVMTCQAVCFTPTAGSRINVQSTTPINTGIYNWATWSDWTHCNATCNKDNGVGKQLRTRMCLEDGDKVKLRHCQVPYIDNGDEPFNIIDSHVIVRRGGSVDPSYVETAVMTCHAYCPTPTTLSLSTKHVVNGGWSQWSDWLSSCSSAQSYQVRARVCNSPEPLNGGLACVGSATETQPCPANTWSEWSAYSSCTVTCGNGQKSRARTCLTGNDCIGTNTEQIACTESPCAPVIDGQWGQWSSFGDCSASCGIGVHFRSRQCNNPSPANGGHNCLGNSHEFRKCNLGDCPIAIDGGWSNYTVMACSATCGLGVQASFRTCNNPPPANGGKNCTGLSHTFQHCKVEDCATAGGWSEWSVWGSCDQACGIGSKSRTRTCDNPLPAHGGEYCHGNDTESQICQQKLCPIDGGWSNYTNIPCSTTCGLGVVASYRTCTNPVPSNGGNNCTGSSHHFSHCQMPDCPIDGSWTAWTQWEQCDMSCGNGTQRRVRSCTQPAPAKGGKDCEGDAIETQLCNSMECPVDGGYGQWSDWSSCHPTCGNGTTFRIRTCDSPEPKYGGKVCDGDFLEKQTCFLKECPIDGGWSSYVNQTCSVTCGTGTIVSVRTCSNPAPAFGGKACQGSDHEEITCIQKPCPIDGGWSDWSAWGSCDQSCDNGTQTRTRSCDNPGPQNGGQNCSGETIETQNCFEKHCPIDGGWGSFKYLPCSVTCGLGTEVSVRECNNPEPKYGGKDCVGLSHNVSECQMPLCVVDGGWSEWNILKQCSSVCGDGYTQKIRSCTNPAPANGGQNCTGESETRSPCNSGPCPSDVPVCNKTQVLHVLHKNYLFATPRTPPCSNMDYISQEIMMKSVCNAPADVNLWQKGKNIRDLCESIPLYSPITKIHKLYFTTEYGVVIDCYKNQLKYATETCDQGVHEIPVDLQTEDTWDYFTMTW